jgi:oxygen-dependent protoporphyrinogen oxidase
MGGPGRDPGDHWSDPLDRRPSARAKLRRMGRRRVVIVGAGITGLATAHALLERLPDAEVTLLERAMRPGGNISTEREDGYVIDSGPDSWVSAKPQATALARAVGLSDELVGTLEANRRVYVAWKEGLYPLPEGFVLGVPTEIMPIVRTPLFSVRAKLRMGLEPFVPRHVANGEDESIASFVRRRLGKEVAERLVAPLLGGIYGGDAAELSIRATLPQFVDAEAKHGSLVLAMRAQRAAAKGGRSSESAFTTLRGGIGDFIAKLAARMGPRLRTGIAVSKLDRLSPGDVRGRLAVAIEGGAPMFADDVVLAVPANASARLLAAVEPEASALLGAIPHASTAVVFLAFGVDEIARSLDATGYIVPKTLGSPALAVTWVTSKWGARAPFGAVLIRVFLGGPGRQELVTRDDAALRDLAAAEVRTRMGVTAPPRLTRVYRFLSASAQPLVGHLGRIATVRERLAGLPGLHVAGSGYDGVGIPDCVRQAGSVAAAIASEPS